MLQLQTARKCVCVCVCGGSGTAKVLIKSIADILISTFFIKCC